ncbi:MAG TPA: Rne/Rng family ribonuclease [Pyrinomonadaceae bacterium]|nr:Rne/Rng family ribonuclease [Pyrinomonadaceae bacterium]
MPKELIISVNGREKKIAIVENEQVTEFYIERGEEHQGIVGNIYKGRVMRVLPGMQSAFVDIGLERDAFLYVSDFFDEEEEFERIVMDKSKKSEPRAEVERAAQERIEQARLEREHRMEATQERAEPLLDSAVIPEEALIDLSDISEDEADMEETAAPTVLQATEQQDETDAGGAGGRKRGRRGRRRGGKAETAQPFADAAAGTTHSLEAAHEEIATPFVAADSSFERVVDEDESAAEEGEMFKDARLQERIFDQIHAVEFDMDDEDLRSAEVGSLLSSNLSGEASFERIDDSDEEGLTSATAPVQETVAAHINSFIDEVDEETQQPQFERVSDDEKASEAEAEAGQQATGSKRGKRAASKRGAKKGASKEPEEDRAEEAPAKPARKSSKKAATKTAAKKSSKASKAASKKGRSRRSASGGGEGETDIDVLESESKRAARTDLVASNAADGEHFEADTDDQTFEDAEASLSSSRSRAEFATRRGGRRRRRSGPPGKHGDGNHEDRTNGRDEVATATREVEEAPPQQAAPPANGRREHRGGGGGGGDRRETRRERERSQPTITDLLREGQEILVQIAKEPIAKKGARITSHIALPGRFLVYMPTVEHVGVSRKIESDSERARLRRLIQAIRAEEDVPSGGFIVRTAGVGISEQDLREDARYLVRTWLDIRRSAEKMKAPAMAHRDLDLIQRILRDQLSDDFTAIRVDSEEEYLSIVEFINRIQPRMVKRVKLYTRDEPILEAYGVQAEVDKAIKPRVWLKSGGYLVINQTEALVAIDVNTGKFVGRGGTRLEDTITKTNLEAVEEIVRQIRLRDLGGIIVLDLIDMEDRRNRNRVMQALQEALQNDKSPTKVLSFNDFGLVIMTRKRVKQSLERTLCSPCPYCQGAGLVKSPQTICYEVLEEARRLSRAMNGDRIKQTTLRVNPEIARALRSTERDVLTEIEDYLGAVDVTSDEHIHQEQFDFAFI